MNSIIISIVVPVYNAERFIGRMIESVEPQLTDEMELILVNDGSTDNSGAICDRYAQKNPRIQVIHKENGGVSTARNAGIDRARGQYISFVDSDDTMDAGSYEKIRQIIQDYQPDMIDFGWKYISPKGVVSGHQHELPKDTLLGEDFIIEKIMPPMLNLSPDKAYFIFPFSCNKLFRRSILDEQGIRFEVKYRVWEDRPFVVQYLSYCRSYYSIPDQFYNYVGTPGSLSVRYDPHFLEIILWTYGEYVRYFGDRFEFDTPYANSYWCTAIEKMIFRSLEEAEESMHIHSYILDALGHEQVIYWYDHRGPCGPFEKKVTALVVAGQREQALKCYIAESAKRRKQRNGDLRARLGRVIRRILKK